MKPSFAIGLLLAVSTAVGAQQPGVPEPVASPSAAPASSAPASPPPAQPSAVLIQTTVPLNRDSNVVVTPPTQTPEESQAASLVDSVIEPKGMDTSSFSWIPGTGTHRFGMLDLELGDRLTNPWISSMWGTTDHIFHTRLGFGVHWWQDPVGDVATQAPDVPPKVFDLYLDCAWHFPVTDWLTGHIDVTPGIYTDFRTTPPEAFRWRGKAVGIVGLSDEFQVSAGVWYANRLTVRTLPAGGIIWQPSSDTRMELVFPYPRITHRFFSHDGNEWWGYIAGEWGGGAWTFKNDVGGHEWVEYDDYRLLLGVEWQTSLDVAAHFEVGYIFHRQLRNLGALPDLNPSDGMIFRVGLVH